MSANNPQSAWSDPAIQDKIAKLRTHFASIPPEPKQQITGWDEAWGSSITPWDRGRPNPALIDALNERPELTSGVNDAKSSTRKKALIPGCGRGVDVLLLSSHGFDAYGLDASARAIEAARQLAAAEVSAGWPNYPIQTNGKATQEGRGRAEFIVADFFADDFVAQTHADSANGSAAGFDFIYDYTFLCALPPPLRPRWAKRMAELLSPTGRLVCLEFPLTKDPKAGGPPHGLSGALYEQLFRKPGADVEYKEDRHVVEESSAQLGENALVQVARWRPQRSFAEANATVQEFISVWEHRKS